ncbi:hypothetical protein F1847_02170 [Thermodesulfobacterium sp. TA1]|uniref:hypothetical protein n=1 Tax=Thermodesulfobacterium sp. TA1 TaxID=2234087 RepID=UPI001231EB1A|nr:hypothetical protein [Thermodesulfobacterium sp. TA1]QER41605.1 hypothetical protein F1847_02170 [Thermodesulfobacterium sp. TA1]
MQGRFPKKVTEEEKKEILTYLEERFGLLPELFEDYEILKGVSNFWLFPKTSYLNFLTSLEVQTVGLLFLRKVSSYLKPTSAFLQRFGDLATKNVVTLSSEIIEKLKERKKVEIDLDLSPGYVILRDEKWVLGCGLYLPGKLFAYLEEKVLRNL